VNVSALSGMQAALRLFDDAAGAIANTTAAPDAALAEHVTHLITASIAYDANARVAQTRDEVSRTAVDLLA